MVCVCGHGKSSHQISYQLGHKICCGKYTPDGKGGFNHQDCACTDYVKASPKEEKKQ